MIEEEFDLTGDDGEDAAFSSPPLAQFGNKQTTVPGMIVSVQVDQNATEPYATDGAVVIPRGQIQDAITNVQPGNGWNVQNGTVQVGYANSGSAGVISSATIAATSSKTPTINNGEIVFPLAQAKADPQATTADTPGAISGIEYAEGFCLGIVDGVVQIPKPKEYMFDADWFTVDGDTVSLRQDALESVINELADEMSVEVTGSGILEETYAGTLRANTSGSLTLDTNVTY